jgi:hypothetical protein
VDDYKDRIGISLNKKNGIEPSRRGDDVPHDIKGETVAELIAIAIDKEVHSKYL